MSTVLLDLLNARTVYCLVIKVCCSEDVLISSRYVCQLFADFLSKAMPLEVCFLQQCQNLAFRQFQVRIENPQFQAFCNSSVCKKIRICLVVIIRDEILFELLFCEMLIEKGFEVPHLLNKGKRKNTGKVHLHTLRLPRHA